MKTAEKIKNARKALSALGGQVSEEVWSVVKCIQHELDDAADETEQLEAALELPGKPEAVLPLPRS